MVEQERRLGIFTERDALHLMLEGGFRHVPVVEDGRQLGMVSARDALGVEMVSFEKEVRQRDDLAERL